jgi:hypothetical protein
MGILPSLYIIIPPNSYEKARIKSPRCEENWYFSVFQFCGKTVNFVQCKVSFQLGFGIKLG